MNKKKIYASFFEPENVFDRINKRNESPWKNMKKQIMDLANNIGNYHVGLLYGDWNKLMLTDLEGKEVYELWEADSIIYAIEFANNDIYFGGWNNTVTKLFEGKVFKRNYYVSSILGFNNKVYDSGWYGIVETESGKPVIDESKMEIKDATWVDIFLHRGKVGRIGLIDTLFKVKYKGKEMLACGVRYNDDTHGIWIVDVENQKLLKKIRKYDIKHDSEWQAFAWNKGEQKIVSCVNLRYIDIDGNKIEETEINREENIYFYTIHRVVHVVDKNGEEWFYCSRHELVRRYKSKNEQIWWKYSGSIRRYNLRTGRIEKILGKNVSNEVLALKPVTKEQWDLIFERYEKKFGKKPKG